MKVLHVNNVDVSGRRFNGYDLMTDLGDRGFGGKQAVLEKSSSNPNVVSLFAGPGDVELQHRLGQVEDRHSMRSILYPWGCMLSELPEFREADVVHYHLIHTGVLSLLDVPRLFALKPSVWTIHDPWAVTGHCIYPMGCEGWRDECSPCPFLDLPYSMHQDCAGRMWKIKQRVYSEIDVDLVVASEYMLDMVTKSRLTERMENVHLVPFGIDASDYLPDSARAESRKSLGIGQDDFVILFRSTESAFKGLSHIIGALGSGKPTRPTTLLTLDARGLVDGLKGDYRVMEFGWVEDQRLYARLLSAADVLLMPSTAEAFGLMALEAMAAARPVVSFEGTSLPFVTRAPECGIAVPMCDDTALRAALDSLSRNPADAQRRGRLGREIALAEYSHERYLDAMADMYRVAYERQRTKVI